MIGRSERIDALSAAFLNAASANVLDFDDTHVATVIHPTAPVAPALFALAELRRVSGADLLLAFILGVEIECRIGRAISPGHYAKGWHITATCGVFGAATGAGKLLGLDPERMVWALANAATQSSGLCECLGWPAKSIGVGNAARNGLWSALLAEKGFEGPPEPIAGVQGFLNAMAEPPEWSSLTEGLGATWEIGQNSIKPYPCGFVIHPFLDCVLDWRRAHPTDAVERVVLRGHPLLSDRTDRPDIATGRESQVSVQHAIAAALLLGTGGARPVHRRLRARSGGDRHAAQGRGGARPRDRDHCGGGRAVDGGWPQARPVDVSGTRQPDQPDERPRSRGQAARGRRGLALRLRRGAADRGDLDARAQRGRIAPTGVDAAAVRPTPGREGAFGRHTSFAISRSLNFWILPVEVFGSSVNTT